MKYSPYVPSERLCAILDEYMERLDITKSDVCRELEAQTGRSADSWFRSMYRWYSGESKTVRFPIVDEILTSLYLIDRWYTELGDIYERAA